MEEKLVRRGKFSLLLRAPYSFIPYSLYLIYPIPHIINQGNPPEKKIVALKRPLMRFIRSYHNTIKIWVLIDLTETPYNYAITGI